MKRDQIIIELRNKLEPMPYIYAMWLEGADASDLVDEYSDLDIYIDFEDEYEEQAIGAVEEALAEIAPIDYRYIMKHPHPKLRQRIYHLAGSSEYLMIDFCWQLHSRSREEYSYIIGNLVESAKVIFDKKEIIQFQDENENAYKEENITRLEECKYRYSQHCRVIKYVHRKQYLEAYAYYNRYVLEPLIDLLRLTYTPAHAYYYLIHISHHIPKIEAQKLEYFAKVSSLEDIQTKIPQAQEWFQELLRSYSKE
jgi:hypothetical protein